MSKALEVAARPDSGADNAVEFVFSLKIRKCDKNGGSDGIRGPHSCIGLALLTLTIEIYRSTCYLLFETKAVA